MINPSNAISVCVQYQNLVIIVPANGLAPNQLAECWLQNSVFFKFCLAVKDFGYILLMTFLMMRSFELQWSVIIKWSNITTQIARFTWPTWGPPGSCRRQVGPIWAPWTLLSGKVLHTSLQKLRQNVKQKLNTQKTPHTLTGEPCSVCEYFWWNWPYYNGTAMFCGTSSVIHCIIPWFLTPWS